MKKWSVLLLSVFIFTFIFTSCGVKGAEYNYDLNEYLTLGQYKGIEVSTEEIETSLAEQINSLLESYSTEEVQTEGTVAEGDTVNISYIGTLDGEVFDGGTAAEVDLTIGSGSYIEGFEEGLVGVKIGDSVVLDLQFPEDYSPNPDMSSAEVQFDVTVHSKKVSVLPDYTDEFIAGISSIEENTIEEFEIALRKDIKENLIWDAVMSNTTFKNYPKKEVRFYYDMMIDQYENMAMYQYGTSLEYFITAYMGSDYDTFLASMLDTAKGQVEKDLVTYAIARAENITAAGDDYDELALKYAVLNGFESAEDYQASYGKAEVERAVIMGKLMEFLSSQSTEI